ncbi:hypothetical protein BC567DRAFT_100508 [Phyllosticta citribraziliensis]
MVIPVSYLAFPQTNHASWILRTNGSFEVPLRGAWWRDRLQSAGTERLVRGSIDGRCRTALCAGHRLIARRLWGLRSDWLWLSGMQFWIGSSLLRNSEHQGRAAGRLFVVPALSKKVPQDMRSAHSDLEKVSLTSIPEERMIGGAQHDTSRVARQREGRHFVIRASRSSTEASHGAGW